MFVDVRGFTALAERLTPAEVVERLNRFYSLATNAVFEYDGTVDKLVGDQVMAFFGAPVHAEDHPRRAIETAITIMRGVGELAKEHALEVGAGIATGEAFVGNVGGGGVTDYTVLGDTVNVAARLQGAAAPGEILVTQESYTFVESEFPSAPRRELELKGKSGTVVARVIATS
jgi:adenylate cyclase